MLLNSAVRIQGPKTLSPFATVAVLMKKAVSLDYPLLSYIKSIVQAGK